MVSLLERMARQGVVMTEASLSRIERSLQPVDTPALHAIAKALGVPLYTVMTGLVLDVDGVEHIFVGLPDREQAIARRFMKGLAEDARAEPDQVASASPKPRRPTKR